MSYRSVFKPDLFAGQNIIVTGGGSGMGCHGAGSAIARGASATRASISRRDLLPSFEPAESALPAVVLHDWSALRAPI